MYNTVKVTALSGPHKLGAQNGKKVKNLKY
jgi:hypothetical protein